MSVAQRLREIRDGFERPFWVANFTELFERLAYYGPQAVLAIYLHEYLGLTTDQSTWLIGYYRFVVWFMPVVGGAAADRFGFRPTLAGAFVMLAIGNFLLGSLSASSMDGIRQVLPLYALMHLIMLIPAMGPAVVKPVVVGTTARAAKENVRSVGYTIYYTVVNVGSFLGPLVASFVRTNTGVENVFRVSALAMLGAAVVTLLFYEEPSRGDEPRVASIGEPLGNLVRVLGDVRFVTFLVIFSGFGVVFWQQYISLPIYVRTYVDPNANVDRLLAWEAGTVIATTFLVNYATREVPPFLAIIAGVLISSLSWLFLTLGSSVPYIVAALIVLAIGEVVQAPRYYEYISRLAPPGPLRRVGQDRPGIETGETSRWKKRKESEADPMKNPTAVDRKSERELVVTRTFNGPSHIVFEAWTKPELIKRWWAPKSFGISFISCEADGRTGGTYRFVFSHSASEQPMAFFGRYIEVTPHSRIVWTNEESADGSITTVTFEEKDGKTLLVMHELYPSKQAIDDAIASGSTGTSGAGEQFDLLDELLVTLV